MYSVSICHFISGVAPLFRALYFACMDTLTHSILMCVIIGLASLFHHICLASQTFLHAHLSKCFFGSYTIITVVFRPVSSLFVFLSVKLIIHSLLNRPIEFNCCDIFILTRWSLFEPRIIRLYVRQINGAIIPDHQIDLQVMSLYMSNQRIAFGFDNQLQLKKEELQVEWKRHFSMCMCTRVHQQCTFFIFHGRHPLHLSFFLNKMNDGKSSIYSHTLLHICKNLIFSRKFSFFLSFLSRNSVIGM